MTDKPVANWGLHFVSVGLAMPWLRFRVSGRVVAEFEALGLVVQDCCFEGNPKPCLDPERRGPWS